MEARRSPLGQALQSSAEADQACHDLKMAGLRLHPTHGKNWDMALFLGRIRALAPPSARVVDLGCATNPLLRNLATLGYRDLWGLDFKLGELGELGHPAITYLTGDLLHVPLQDATVDVLSCLSVIEHGVSLEAYFKEAVRLLRPGGLLLTSTDYWPTRVPTWSVRRRHTFGLPWTIFTAKKMARLRAIAERNGLVAAGAWDWGTKETVADWNGRNYTFYAFEMVKDEGRGEEGTVSAHVQ